MKELYEYEDLLDKDKKKKMGITYTPEKIVHYINEACLKAWTGKNPPKVVDFSAGTGVFLVDMAKKISERYNISLGEVYRQYIFANDLDVEAVNLFSSTTGCKNITTVDGLGFDLSEYDIIIGNPPYVKIQNLSKEDQTRIRNFSWCKTGNTDLYIAFCEMMCTSGKIFGFICPNSWQKTATGQEMRNWFLNSKIISTFVDFRHKKVFDVSAYTSILLSDSIKKESYVFQTDLDSDTETKKFDEVTADDFFLYTTENTFIKQNREKSNLLFDKCSMKVGIATLADGVYFLKDCKISGKLVLFGEEKIEKAVVKHCYKASKLVRYDDDTHDMIIYPYDNKKSLIPERTMKKKYPLAYKYLEKHKEKLLQRDAGKFKKKCNEGKAVWYEYGRTQGLGLKSKKILISPIMCKKYFMSIDDGLFMSGYCLEVKKDSDYEDVLAAIQQEDFKKWVHLFGSPKSGGYYSLNKAALKKYRY
tara:strand:- start:1917 stop:3338 length:1422 start_codon:yes stop_codon:yes gene_type:complete